MPTETKQLTAADMALYLGCMCFDAFNGCKVKLTPKNFTGYADHGIDQIKPILRPILDMSLDEWRDIFSEPHAATGYVSSKIELMHLSRLGLYQVLSKFDPGRALPDLLSRRFDLFGWIDAGLALDATRLEHGNPYDPNIRKCRKCGCTEQDCRYCIETTGEPCHWVSEDLCSACQDEEVL